MSDVQYTFTVPNVRAYDTGISQNVAFALMLGTTGCRSYIYLGVSFEFDHRDKSSKLHGERHHTSTQISFHRSCIEQLFTRPLVASSIYPIAPGGS